MSLRERDWTQEETKAAKVEVEVLYAKRRFEWEEHHEYGPTDHHYGHYRPVAIDLQCSLTSTREQLATAREFVGKMDLALGLYTDDYDDSPLRESARAFLATESETDNAQR